MFNFTEKSFISSLFFSCILLTSIIAIPIKTFGETILHGGQEFQINTHTASEQIRPSVATLLNGNFVVVWQSKHQDGSNIDIYAQIFNESGNKVDDEFRVNTHTANEQRIPSVTVLNNGNFVVVWSSDGQDGDSWGVYAKIFKANGSEIDSEFLVNTHISSAQDHPFVAALNNGDFVVAWHSFDQDGDDFGIYAQIFNPSGIKVVSEFQVNTNTAAVQWSPSIAVLENGDFVVTWHSYHEEDNAGIFAQIFNTSGEKVGNEIQVNTYTTNAQVCPSVAALSNGNFVITWDSWEQDGSSAGIYAQIFNESGDKVGNELQVNTHVTDEQSESSVTALSNSNFIVTWRSNNQDGDLLDIYGKIFDASGTELSNEFQVNVYTASYQYWPHISSFKNGNFVVVWHSLYQDGNNFGIFGRIFTPNMIPTIGDLTKVGVKNTALLFDKTDFTDLFTDADGHSMTKIKITSLPGGGSLKLLSSGVVTEGQEMDVDDIEYLVFDPNEGWTGTTFFGWQAFDGLDYSDVKAVNINIENRANGLAIEATSKKSVCGCDVSTSIDDTLNITDTNDVYLRGAKVTMSRDVDLAFDSLEFDDQNGITGSYDPSKGILLLDGKSSVDNYQEALRSVKYKHRGAFLPSKSIAMSLAVNDGFSDSDPVVVNINGEDCPVGDPPIIGDVYKEGIEDDVVSFTKDDFADKFRDKNADNELVQIEIVSLPEYGILKSSRFGNVVAGQKILAENLDDLRFVPDKDWVGDPSFKWKGYNCQSSSEEANVNIKVSGSIKKALWGSAPDAMFDTIIGIGSFVGGVMVSAAVFLIKERLARARRRNQNQGNQGQDV